MPKVAASAEGGGERGNVVHSATAAPLVRLRSCTENDIPKLMQFIHQHWLAGHVLSRDETLLRWQFHSSRAETELFPGLTVVLAVSNGEIGGMLGLIPFDFNCNGTTRRGGWLSQWFCVPELRRYKIGRALLWEIQKLKYDALLGIGVSQAGSRVMTALGFQPIPPIPRWVGVFDVTGAQQLLQSVAPLAEPHDLAQALLPYIVHRRSPALGPSSIRITPWADSLRGPWDRFWIRSLAPDLVGPARDSSYLLWRYIAHPRFHYEIRVAQTEAGEILGLSVFRVETVQGRSAKVMRIVEFLASPVAHSALAGALVEAARDHDVTFADFYCTRPEAGAALEAMGFRRHAHDDTPVSLPSRLQPLQPGDAPLTGLEWLKKDLRQQLGALSLRADVHITKSDSDQDRPN
jgi:hypothetical protein